MNPINFLFTIALVILVGSGAFFIKYQVTKKNQVQFPFFISTRDSTTNLRSGPSKEYPIILIYNKRGFPLKTLSRHNEWYAVEDFLGNRGWVYKNITTTKNTALITASETTVYRREFTTSKKVAIITKHNIIEVKNCPLSSLLCKIELKVKNSDLVIVGWVYKGDIWGANTLGE